MAWFPLLSARICLSAQRFGLSLFCTPSCVVVLLKAYDIGFDDEASVVILTLVAAHVRTPC